MVHQHFVEEKNKPNTLFTNVVPQKRKQPPTQPCTFIIPYFNTMLLKTPKNFTTFEFP